MALDNTKNFSRSTVSTGYVLADVSIDLTAGGGAKFPTVPFNATWWNSSDYSDPSLDPDAEIVRVTAISTDTLTITRAQEGTAASDKDISGKTYTLIAALTAKTINIDLPAEYVQGAANLGTATAIPVVSAAGVVTSDNTLFNFDLVNCRLGIGMTTPTNEIQIQRTKSGGSTIVVIQNLSNTALSNAYFACYTAGTSGGGAFTKYSILSVAAWCAGIESADSKFRIAYHGDVSGTAVAITCVPTTLRVGITEQSPGSLLSVYGNMSVGADTAYSQAAAPTDGMAIKGSVGIGKVTPTASLDVAGSIAWGTYAATPVRRSLIASYVCAVGVFVPINLTDASQLLVNGYAYRVTLNTAGTGTPTGAVYIVTYASGPVWTARCVTHNGLSSNHPQLRVNVAGTGLEVFHLHGSQTYTIATIVETYGTQGNTTVIATPFFGLEGLISAYETRVLIGSTTSDNVNMLQVTGSIWGTNCKVGTATAGTYYLGTDLAMYISRSTTTMTIAGAASTSIAGDVFIGANLILSNNNTSYYGRDTASTSILLMRCASDNTVRVGPQTAMATNGHMLLYAGASEAMRLVPTTFFVNIGNGQSPTALLSVNERAGTVFASSGAMSTAFLVNAGTLGTTATNELSCGSIGGKCGSNGVALGVRLYRLANGTDWTTSALGIGMDVDSSVRAGAAMFFHNDDKISMGTQITSGLYTLKIAGAIADVPGLTLAATNSSGGVMSGTLSFLGSTGKDWRQFIGSSAEMIFRDANNGRNLIRLDTGGAIELGNNNATTGFTVSIYDATASTGVTALHMRAGAGQSTAKLMEVYANDGTTLLHAITASGQLITATGTPASATATGVAGTVVWDADYIYVCIATDTWKRIAIATWP